MLAATCSKIGSPAQTDEGYGQGGDSGVRVIGAGQGGGAQTDAITGWMQLANGTIVDSTGKPVANAGNVIQQAAALQNNVGGQIFAQGQQIIATPGPNGQMTYSVVPSYQTVNIDGQDAFIIPSSVASSSTQPQVATAGNVQAAQPQILAQTATGQIIRTQGLPTQSANAAQTQQNIFQNMQANLNMGNLVNIGGNIVNLGNVQNSVRPNNNIMQAVQIPGLQTLQQVPQLIQVPVSFNGQTVLQTIQLPTQNIPIQAPVQQANGGGVVTLGTNPQSLQSLMASQSQPQVQTSQPTPASQPDEPQLQNQSQPHKVDSKPSMGQLSMNHSTPMASAAATPPKSSGLQYASNPSTVQALSVINTPQGQVILSPPTNQVQQLQQTSQSLPTLTVPSYPQTISTNASSSAATTTSTTTPSAPVLQNLAQQQQQLLQGMAKENILAQQQLLQGMASGQNLGGLQALTNQSQLQWLQVSEYFL